MTNNSSAPKGTNKVTPPLSGSVPAPGDKSISHRSLIFGALAKGTTKITGLLEGQDILHTADAMRGFGADVTRHDDGTWSVIGCGDKGWKSPKNKIDFGNAGTGVRLVMGAAAGFDIKVDYIGDKSLSSRPMGRVLNPLGEMGAEFTSTDGRLPLSQTKGGALTPIKFTPPHASAQVKSCLLLAGLNTQGTTTIHEPTLTRDHTENMLRAFGVTVDSKAKDFGAIISIKGPAALTATNIIVPGDPSSAAFLIAAALIVPKSDIIIKNVMMNPTRTGLFEVLISMGGFVRADNFNRSGGETLADIHVRHSKLKGVTVGPERVPSMVDEYPILAVVASFANGPTILQGLGELRVKESDRLAATHALLTQNGVEASIEDDDLRIEGTNQTDAHHVAPKGGATVTTHHDHRIAMSALILGLGCQNPVSVDDTSMINTSFPTFFNLMKELGADLSQ